MAKRAILLRDGSQPQQQHHLNRVLDFFGVPWETVDVSRFSDLEWDNEEHVVFGLTESVATALTLRDQANRSSQAAACYVYTGHDLGATKRGLQCLSGDRELSVREAPAGIVSVRISRGPADLAGPMAGLEFRSRLRREDAVLDSGDPSDRLTSVITVEDAPVFVRFQHNGIPIFFCGSSHIVNIDHTIESGFFDVKDDFCSTVPLVMFIRLAFQDVAWRSQELGACLIIDDPLLRRRYGLCDFEKLHDIMRRRKFTTNIAFIPWNWRRTSPTSCDFFKEESGFSVSVHGCDHVDSEFGTTSVEVLNTKARLAQSRMRNHEARTGIHHDPVMVFPQGVFSSLCPEVLKRNGFLAAVNTETVPVDSQSARTTIRDVWDIAILTYSDFPILTRRYASHGLENFAFDLLLGKPCLIVCHHEFFKDSGAGLIELLEKLRSFDCFLRWRSLGEVIRRACRRRLTRAGIEEVQMYGNELIIENTSEQSIEVWIRKKEHQTDLVAEIQCDGHPVRWTSEVDHVLFSERIGPHSERRFQVIYREQADSGEVDRSLRFELSVAIRRFLCEVRDDYFARSTFLSRSLAGLRGFVRHGVNYSGTKSQPGIPKRVG